MGWQNVFAAVFQAGNTVIINGNGMTVYNGAPAAGNLVASISPTNYTDPYGNAVLSGETVYSGFGTLSSNYAVQIGPLGIAQYDCPAGESSYTIRGSFLIPQNNPRTSWSLDPGSLILGSEPNPTADIAGLLHVIFQSDSNGRPLWFVGGNPLTALWNLDRSQTDSTQISIPSGSPVSSLTKTYTADKVNGNIVGSTYTIRTHFNGVWEQQGLNFFALIGTTSNHIADIAALFVPGVALGDTIEGWLELSVVMVAATTCKAHITGSISDVTIAGGSSNVTGCPINGTLSNITFDPTVNGNLGIQAVWPHAVAGEVITSYGSTFTRKG
jgi:hypothetical protein